MMDEAAAGYNPRGIELLCDIIRDQAACLPCPGCRDVLRDVVIDIREITDGHAVIDLTCHGCGTRFTIRAEPASNGGVAVVR
jgi:hypothetical protein